MAPAGIRAMKQMVNAWANLRIMGNRSDDGSRHGVEP
jgi:hypothetical protein